MNFYTSIFKNSRIGKVSRYGDAGPGPKGTVMVGTIYLAGQEFMVLNGVPSLQAHARVFPAGKLRDAGEEKGHE
jgi:predicted 3-demethylubiquinone-9 3-methyltransferase (glyoxalase superfamily)